MAGSALGPHPATPSPAAAHCPAWAAPPARPVSVSVETHAACALPESRDRSFALELSEDFTQVSDLPRHGDRCQAQAGTPGLQRPENARVSQRRGPQARACARGAVGQAVGSAHGRQTRLRGPGGRLCVVSGRRRPATGLRSERQLPSSQATLFSTSNALPRMKPPGARLAPGGRSHSRNPRGSLGLPLPLLYGKTCKGKKKRLSRGTYGNFSRKGKGFPELVAPSGSGGAAGREALPGRGSLGAHARGSLTPVPGEASRRSRRALSPPASVSAGSTCSPGPPGFALQAPSGVYGKQRLRTESKCHNQ